MALQAIETHYVGPTDYRGSRIVARWGDDKVTVPYSYEVSGSAVHRVAAEAMMAKVRAAQGSPERAAWLDQYVLVAGATRTGYVFVLVARCMVTRTVAERGIR